MPNWSHDTCALRSTVPARRFCLAGYRRPLVFYLPPLQGCEDLIRRPSDPNGQDKWPVRSPETPTDWGRVESPRAL